MTKTLTIRDEVYERLIKIKRENESFSDLFMRLSEEENTLMMLERLRGSIDLPEADEITEEIYQKRVERRYADP